jgi:hypothetical protein
MNPKLPAVRRLVLGFALLAATLVAVLPESPPVRAEANPPVVLAQSTAQSSVEAAREAANAAREVAREAKEAAREAAREAKEAAREAHIDINDRQYDSFDQFLDRDPALAAMVLGIVFIVFLVPILIIGLVIWYKVRKTRMQNETMLKLAEKGIVPPGEAVQAIGSGRVAPVLAAAAGNAPLVEQVKSMRKQAAWSDLRKGVLFGGVGLALTLYHLFEGDTPSWFALVLLFVGIGFIVLWYFEDRQATIAAATPANPASAPGPGDTPR